MGRSLDVVKGRIVSRRVGSVDWQDASESFAMYSALVEDKGASELLMDMAEADVLIPEADARDLATMFVRETPEHLAIAIIKPTNRSGARFIDAFIDALTRADRHVITVSSDAEAVRFFDQLRGRGSQASQSGGLLGALTGLFRKA